MTDPTNVFAMDDVKFMTGYNVEPVVASESMVADAIQRYYNGGKPRGGGGAERPRDRHESARGHAAPRRLRRAGAEELEEISVEALARQGEDAPIIRLVNVMLMSAIHKGRERHPHRARTRRSCASAVPASTEACSTT